MKKLLLAALLVATAATTASAQSELYSKHFNLSEVRLLDGPFKTAMEINNQELLEYDVDRLLTPFVRQAGLTGTTDTSSKYYQWVTKHPKFTNWGDSSFNLEGHIGGHYLTALALAYAASDDEATRTAMKERLDYCLEILKDCQDAFATSTNGMKGFIGGQPINYVWQSLYSGDTQPLYDKRGWVAFYVQHKVLAGLRDAYLYTGSELAKELFRGICDWSVEVVDKLNTTEMEGILNIEHGGMNETLADAYVIFNDEKYLTAAKKYSHKTMLNGMQTLNKTFLDGKHANTQVPKYVGMERIGQIDNTADAYLTATNNFWTDVAKNRTVAIGGNSVGEHFLAVGNSNRYIDHLDGPESCNSNNMLKLSEMMSDRTGDAKYADFYEYTMYNHILSTQDPTTGGYVYFTTLRPGGYRIYSQVNQGMWCCVGTGMENHSKYGHFIYTHEGTEKLYVNLFTASTLNSEVFKLKQETQYPYSQESKITIEQGGTFTLAVRHPWWTTEGYSISVNGEKQTLNVKKGTASYAEISRTWAAGDVVTINIPMELRIEACPNYADYVAIEYGPILLAAQTTATSESEATETGLEYESLQNEYGGEGRMDHAPGSMATAKSLNEVAMLIGARDTILNRVTLKDASTLTFNLDVSREDAHDYEWTNLELRPFYTIHHARYQMYWYQQTPENYAASDMAQAEEAAKALAARTVDFVAPGEQQSEAGHEYNYSSDSSTGMYNNETYRDAKANGYVQYSLFNPKGLTDSLSIMLRFTSADKNRKGTLTVDGVTIADITVEANPAGVEASGFYNVEFPLPASVMTNADGTAKEKFVVRLTASSSTLMPGLYYMRLMSGFDYNTYKFVCTDWTTGDTGRVTADKFVYDTENNTITITAPGANNVCMKMNYTGKNYTIDAAQKYLVVKGTNLSTASTGSYLWWLNGANRGTQVVPTTILTTEEGDQVIAWNMTTSGIADNITGLRPNVCRGQTIFGLTSTGAGGKSVIKYVGYVENVNEFVTGIAEVETNNTIDTNNLYHLNGMKANTGDKGILIDKTTRRTYVLN